MERLIRGDLITAIFHNGTWTCVDESGAQFWPTVPDRTAKAALDACESKTGVWYL